jgi:hypothetical protein
VRDHDRMNGILGGKLRTSDAITEVGIGDSSSDAKNVSARMNRPQSRKRLFQTF